MKYIYCIGNFDGVHLGHQKLIEKTLELAGDKYIPAAITFDPDPGIFFNLQQEILTTAKQKEELFYKYGLQETVILPFDNTLAKMPPEFFIRYILNQLDAKCLVCGSDWRFGDKGAGDFDFLNKSQTRNFDVCLVDLLQEDGVKISSTNIIKLLKDGQIEKANKLLGHKYKYEVEGNVKPKFGNYIIEESDQPYKYKGQKKKITFVKEII